MIHTLNTFLIYVKDLEAVLVLFQSGILLGFEYVKIRALCIRNGLELLFLIRHFIKMGLFVVFVLGDSLFIGVI